MGPHLKVQGKNKRTSLLQQQKSIDKFVEKSFGTSTYSAGEQKNFHGSAREAKGDREVKEFNTSAQAPDYLIELVQPPKLQRIKSMRMRDSGLGAVPIKPVKQSRSNSSGVKPRKSHYESGIQLRSVSPAPQTGPGLQRVVKRF